MDARIPYQHLQTAVELNLKGAIMSVCRMNRWSPRYLGWNLHSHDLDYLGRVGPLEEAARERMVESRAFMINWRMVRDLHHGQRYDLISPDRKALQDRMRAAFDSTDGVIPWLRAR